MNNIDVLTQLKILREGTRELNSRLEDAGLGINDGKYGLAKEQLFSSNVKNIVSAFEAVLRGEAVERPFVRLGKEFPDTFRNLYKVMETPAARKYDLELKKIEHSLKTLEQIFRAEK